MKCLQLRNKFPLFTRERSGAFSSGTSPFLYGVFAGVFSFIASGLFAQNQEISGSWKGGLVFSIYEDRARVIYPEYTHPCLGGLWKIYALKNQNRIIRLEMRLRYFQLSGKPFLHLEKKLKTKQLIALRFAGSKELIPLIDRAIQENLSPGEIKRAIKDWQGDYMRV